MADADERREATAADRGGRADGWQLEGDSAEAYERYLVPGMFAPWADVLVEHAEVAPGDRVLDLGCGTGVVARRAAESVAPDGAVVGLDLNEGMLDATKAASSDVRPAVDWRPGDATDLSFPDGSFDVVLSQQVLQFVPDPAAALSEMHRVLGPDGRLGVAVWRPIRFNRTYMAVADALERHVGEEAAAMMRSPFPPWDLPELRDLVRGAGFPSATVTIEIGSMRYPSAAELLRREAASSPLAGPLGSPLPEVLDALVADVGEALSEQADDEGVVFPMETYVTAGR